MNYDVPLPPCVAYDRWRAAELGWPPMTAAELSRAIWRHDMEERELFGSYCSACMSLVPWDPYEDVDIGTYSDDAGRRLVKLGLWHEDQVKTARQIADETQRRMLKKERR